MNLKLLRVLEELILDTEIYMSKVTVVYDSVQLLLQTIGLYGNS